MKITRSELKQLIKEELALLLKENTLSKLNYFDEVFISNVLKNLKNIENQSRAASVGTSADKLRSMKLSFSPDELVSLKNKINDIIPAQINSRQELKDFIDKLAEISDLNTKEQQLLSIIVGRNLKPVQYAIPKGPGGTLDQSTLWAGGKQKFLE